MRMSGLQSGRQHRWHAGVCPVFERPNKRFGDLLAGDRSTRIAAHAVGHDKNLRILTVKRGEIILLFAAFAEGLAVTDGISVQWRITCG